MSKEYELRTDLGEPIASAIYAKTVSAIAIRIAIASFGKSVAIAVHTERGVSPAIAVRVATAALGKVAAGAIDAKSISAVIVLIAVATFAKLVAVAIDTEAISAITVTVTVAAWRKSAASAIHAERRAVIGVAVTIVVTVATLGVAATFTAHAVRRTVWTVTIGVAVTAEGKRVAYTIIAEWGLRAAVIRRVTVAAWWKVAAEAIVAVGFSTFAVGGGVAITTRRKARISRQEIGQVFRTGAHLLHDAELSRCRVQLGRGQIEVQ